MSNEKKVDLQDVYPEEDAPEENLPFVARQMKDLTSINFWRAFFAEFLGTFMLCLYTIGYGTIMPEDPMPPDMLGFALCSGFLVAVLIITFLTVSGGHVNPGITIGFFVNGHITLVRFIFYTISQCLSSVAAVLVIRWVTPEEMHGHLGLLLPGPGVTPVQAVVVEFIISFLLLFATFALIDGDRKDNTAPVTIFLGFVVAGNVFFAGRISGGCMNPARNFGPAVISGNMALQWVYWVGGLLGAAAGALAYTQLFSVMAMNGSTFALCRGRKPQRKNKPDRPRETEAMLLSNHESHT